MGKSKFFGKTKHVLSKMLPEQWLIALLSWILQTWYKPPVLVFPWNNRAIKKALIILPEDPVEAFHQINNFLRIAGLFKKAAFFLFCTGKISAIFRQIYPDATIIEYDPRQRFLFSREFDEWGTSFFKEEFDLCLVLERTPDISLLYLAGKTAAPIRAGYQETGKFPFLNMHVNPSLEQPYRAEQNSVMARALGAADAVQMRWTVSKETLEETSHLLHELSIPSGSRLVGIDAGLLSAACDTDWMEKLCKKIQENKTVFCYFLIEEEPDESLSLFLSSMHFPVFSNLSASRYAALIARSACIISGRSVFFELANMLHIAVMGVFKEDECAVYCKQSAVTKAITYSTTLDDRAMEKIILFVKSWEIPHKA